MGRPTVASNTEGLAGYVEHEREALLVPPSNVAALRQAITDLWSNPERRAVLGAAARRLIETRFNFDTYVTALATIVRRVVDGQPPGPASVHHGPG